MLDVKDLFTAKLDVLMRLSYGNWSGSPDGKWRELCPSPSCWYYSNLTTYSALVDWRNREVTFYRIFPRRKNG